MRIAERSAALGRATLCLGAFSLAFMRPALRIAKLAAIPTDAIVLVAGLCWCLALAGGHPRRWDRMFPALLAYAGAMLLSTLGGAPLRLAAFRLAGNLYLLALPVLVVGLLGEEAHLRQACRAWLAGTAVAVAILPVALMVAAVDPGHPLLPLVQHRFGSLPLGAFVRYRLTYDNPNMLGAYLTASLAVVLAAVDRRWIGGVAAAALIAGIAMALVATFSAGIGGAVLLAAAWYWVKRRDRARWRAGGVLALGGACAAAFAAAQALTPVAYADPLFAWRVPGTAITLMPAARFQTWAGALATFAAHPLTGVGIGSPVAGVAFVEPNGSHHFLTDGHNVLLDLAAECGVPGVAAMILILAVVWRRTRPLRLGGSAGDAAAVALGLGVLDVLAYQGIGGGFERTRFVWFLVGLLLVAARLRRGDRQNRVSSV